MRLINFLITLIFLIGCSFDNKSGIWTNESELSRNKEDLFKEFEKISSNKEIYNKIVPLTSNYNFKIPKIFNNLDWEDIFTQKIIMFFNITILIKFYLKVKNTRHKINYILAKNNNLIVSDQREIYFILY